MFRYLSLIRIFAVASLSAQMEYRANFLASVFNALLAAGGALLGLWVLLGRGQSIGGWNIYEATLVVGIYTLLEGISGMIFYPNLARLAESIRTGSMDFVLLKPIDAQFMASSRNVDLLRGPDVILGLGLIFWSLEQLSSVSLSSIFLGLLMFLSGCIAAYSICLVLATTAFWLIRVDNILELFWGFTRAGQFPITAFPQGWVRTFLTFVIPVAFMTTVPAEAMLGRLEISVALTGVGVTTLLVGLSRGFWKLAIRSYTSASS